MSIPNFNPRKKVFIIAEIGNNHEGNFNVAKKLIRSAAKAGADAVKFQTFVTNNFVNLDHPSFGRLKKFEFTHQQFLKLKKLANSQNLNFISTPLDFSSAHFLKKNCKIIKIASGDNNFYDLINIFLEKNKQLIISTGMMNAQNVKNLIEFIFKKKGKEFLKNNLSLLHCVSSYPAEHKSLNLMSIKYLADNYKNINIGYSDHSIGYDACINAVALGARIVEKHFTLSNNFSNFRDHKLSLNPLDMISMVKKIRTVEMQLGKYEKVVQKNEKKAIFLTRRSIIAKESVNKNEILTSSNTFFLRPQIRGSEIINEILNKKKIRKNLKPRELIKNRHLF
ncbi:N-acetylneuraminate synthase family protein [Pelagibacterales bacterium SAG-MED45]|nr:N-acetylneuraminate synthase family protein [Pelagibacterales bacterium SAG-MED45]